MSQTTVDMLMAHGLLQCTDDNCEGGWKRVVRTLTWAESQGANLRLIEAVNSHKGDLQITWRAPLATQKQDHLNGARLSYDVMNTACIIARAWEMLENECRSNTTHNFPQAK